MTPAERSPRCRPPRKTRDTNVMNYLLLKRTIATVFAMMIAAPAVTGQPPDDEKDGEEKLGERLIRQSTSGEDDDIMSGIIRTMGEAAHRLEVEFDSGDATQALHRRIVEQLDEAIQAAASQRRPQRRSGRPASSDKRRMGDEKKRSDGQGKDAKPGEDGSASSKSPDDDGQPAEERPTGGNLEEVRRTWGHLPMREREEIIQGISESFLERYRAWIERYYRALQESEER